MEDFFYLYHFMKTFSITILGSGAAIPLVNRNPSSQLINIQERLFLVDCAEGTQVQLRKNHIRIQKIKNIFISHLHGDHYYGLIGLITSMHLLGRKEELRIFAHKDLEAIINLHLKASNTELRYPLIFHHIDPEENKIVYEDDIITIESIPLNHNFPTMGFLFREKQSLQNIKKDPRSYAYCSDTAYHAPIIPIIKNVDLLYHEATFMDDKVNKAIENFHSTAKQAADIALKANAKKLIIGHYSARYKDLKKILAEAKSIFPDTILADDGKMINIER